VASETYRVVNSQKVADDFRALLARATAEDRLQAVLQASRTILDALKWVPDDFGESMGALPSGMPMRRGLIAPLTVEFAVHTIERVVFTRQFHPWPVKKE
jgi:hypothetical protein